MNPNHYEWITDNTNFINPLGIALTLALGGMLLVLHGRRALIPMLASACFLTMGQRLLLFGINLTMIRVLLCFAWAGLLLRGELRWRPLSRLDKFILAWCAVGLLAHSLQYSDFSGFINRAGQCYDYLGTYFFFRFVMREKDDVAFAIRTLVWMFVPLCAFMLLEHFSGRNIFAALGGVPLMSELRSGAVRSQGPFSHSILAGTFMATAFPLFLGLRGLSRADRTLGTLGMACAMAMAFCAGSSGPLMALFFALLAYALWPWRAYMRPMRWSLLLLLLTLHAVMKAPVWFLIGRITVFQASTGYHRAYLIDRAIANFAEWWMVGVHSTAHWGWEMEDVTNFYIRQGVDGGLVTMLLFIAVIAVAYGAVGSTQRRLAGQPLPQRKLVWALGAALTAHAVSFLSVSYFDQSFVSLCLLLAMISHLSILSVAPSRAASAVPESESRSTILPAMTFPDFPEAFRR